MNRRGCEVMSNIGAFFDLDGTLYREGLITEVFKKMVKYEIIGQERWYNDVRPDYMKWDKRQGDYDDYLLKMIDIYMEAIKGLEKYRIEYIAKKIVQQKGDRVYTFTRDRIKWHKDNGHKLIIISGSPWSWWDPVHWWPRHTAGSSECWPMLLR